MKTTAGPKAARVPMPYRPSETPVETLQEVRVGWSTTRVLEHASYPTRCGDDTWIYENGPVTGPQTTYRFTIKGGVVTSISVSAIACRL